MAFLAHVHGSIMLYILMWFVKLWPSILPFERCFSFSLLSFSLWERIQFYLFLISFTLQFVDFLQFYIQFIRISLSLSLSCCFDSALMSLYFKVGLQLCPNLVLFPFFILWFLFLFQLMNNRYLPITFLFKVHSPLSRLGLLLLFLFFYLV